MDTTQAPRCSTSHHSNLSLPRYRTPSLHFQVQRITLCNHNSMRPPQYPRKIPLFIPINNLTPPNPNPDLDYRFSSPLSNVISFPRKIFLLPNLFLPCSPQRVTPTKSHTHKPSMQHAPGDQGPWHMLDDENEVQFPPHASKPESLHFPSRHGMRSEME